MRTIRRIRPGGIPAEACTARLRLGIRERTLHVNTPEQPWHDLDARDARAGFPAGAPAGGELAGAGAGGR